MELLDFAVQKAGYTLGADIAINLVLAAEYNRLLEIEKELGRSAKYAGRAVYAKWVGELVTH